MTNPSETPGPRRPGRALVVLAAVCVAVLFAGGGYAVAQAREDDEDRQGQEKALNPPLSTAECFSPHSQQISMAAKPDSTAVRPARLDAGVAVGFSQHAMCLAVDAEFLRPGWRLDESRVTVTRANTNDAWAAYSLTQVLGASALEEGAGDTLPVLVPFDLAGIYGVRDQECFLIEATFPVRGPDGASGSWSVKQKRGICPGTRWSRESIEDDF